MATVNDTRSSPSSVVGDWLLQAIMGLAVVLLGMGVWLYLSNNGAPAAQDKPRPVWLGVSEVLAQMSDGRMVNVKVNLKLGNEQAIAELAPHKPAFQALIQEAGTQVSREDIQGPEGMRHFGATLRDTLNGYLEEQDVPTRIKQVVFDELTLMP